MNPDIQNIGDIRFILQEVIVLTQKSYSYEKRGGLLPISWEDFHGLCKTLALGVSSYRPEIILPIGRGGYYPGTLLAHILQIEIYPLRISRRVKDQVVYETPHWILPPPPEINGQRVLVVDEICDSGETLELSKEKCLAEGAAQVRTAVLYAHKRSAHLPDYIGIITDELLLNPWDREILQDGSFVFHPEYEEALRLQGLEKHKDLLIPAREIKLAKGENISNK